MSEKDNPGAPASAHGADQNAAGQQLDPYIKSEIAAPVPVGATWSNRQGAVAPADARPITAGPLYGEGEIERLAAMPGRKANGHDEKRGRRVKDGRATAESLGPLWRAIRALRYVKPVEENLGIVAAAL